MRANLAVAILPRIVCLEYRAVAVFMRSLNMCKRRCRPTPLRQRDVDVIVIGLPIQFSLHLLDETLVSQVDLALQFVPGALRFDALRNKARVALAGQRAAARELREQRLHRDSHFGTSCMPSIAR